jgi:hypothetical protein
MLHSRVTTYIHPYKIPRVTTYIHPYKIPTQDQLKVHLNRKSHATGMVFLSRGGLLCLRCVFQDTCQ